MAELSPTGWLRVRDATGETRVDAAQTTEYQLAFRAAVDAVRNHAWGAHEPYFERLEIRVDLPGIDFALPVDEEIVSTYEALHEDLYFALLEHFQQHSGRPPGDRGLQRADHSRRAPPRRRRARAHLGRSLHAHIGGHARPARLPAGAGARAAVGGADRRLHGGPGRRHVPGHLAPGQAGAGHLRGPGPAVFISGAQHANETSGVVGALRAALAASGKGHFALIAAENPDGYALFARLREQHPRHMLHASRYSALGDDIAYRERAPFFERDGRHQAHAISGAQLHINLHGYPAHEWTRPMSGYLPRHFELWTIPKGFSWCCATTPAGASARAG